ncbi:MAG TPA: hypothetical protein VMP08_19100 [Anaerolineae bacterium]|nr:hypothetical protein [Anaerolineae bacterium]
MIRDDHIYRFTRLLAVIIIPFLIVAWVILYLLPERSGELFAWPIKPSMTAMMLAAAYLGGVYFFARVVSAKQWHAIKAGLLPVTLFASLLGIATILHWDKFTHDHISFFTWTLLYFTTPFLVFGTWWFNRRTDPRILDTNDIPVPNWMRWLLGIAGAITLAISLLLFLLPQLMIGIWPWTLTPLTARVMGAMFALPGLVGLGIASDRRWSAARIILQAQAFSIGLILIAAVRSWSDFNPTSISTWLFIGGLSALLIGIIILYGIMEARHRKP